MKTPVRQYGVSTPSPCISPIPPIISSAPSTGQILYRPVALIARPEISEPSMIPAVRGSSCSPERVGEAPCTICR